MRLVVPAYQRPFAWGVKEAAKLLADLQAGILRRADGGEADSTDAVFLSALLFVDRGRIDGNQVFEIVDGQQRLVTLTILLSVIRDLLAEATTKSSTYARLVASIGTATHDGTYRLSVRAVDGQFLADYIQRPGACLEMPGVDPASPAQENMLEVREHLAGELAKTSVGELNELAEFIFTGCSAAIITIATTDRAHQFFSALNGRGKELGRQDILKAELIGELRDGSDRDWVLEEWSAIEQKLGHEFEGLFSHIHAMHEPSAKQIIEGVRRTVKKAGGPVAFMHSVMTPTAEHLNELLTASHSGSEHSPAINITYRALNMLPREGWHAPALLYRLGPGANPERFLAFLRQMDRLTIGLSLLGLGNGKRVARFNTLSTAIRRGEDPLAAGSPHFEFHDHELRYINNNVRVLHDRSPQACKHILLRLNAYLEDNEIWLDPDKYNVEHILPQRPGIRSRWRTVFPDADLRVRLTNSLGNLTLVDKDDNIAARNLPFEEKLEIYFARPGRKPATLEMLRGITQWTENEITAREAAFMRIIQNIWNFDVAAVTNSASARETSASKAHTR
jgi:hypothetical protein